MNTFLLIIVTIWNVIALWRSSSSKENFWASGFLLGVLYFSVLPIWLLRLVGDFPALPQTSINGISWDWHRETVSVLLLMILLMLAVFGVLSKATRFSASFPRGWLPTKKGIQTSYLLWAYLVVSALVLAYCGLGSRDAHWARNKHEFAVQLGIVGMLLLSLVAGLKYAVLFRVMPSLTKGRPALTPSVHLLVLVIVDLYTTGTRFFLMQVIACVGCTRLLNGERRHVVWGLLLVMPMAHAMTLFTVVRTGMLSWKNASVASALEAFSTGIENATTHYGESMKLETYGTTLTEADSLSVFRSVHHRYQKEGEKLEGATLIKPVVAWVPRSWWPSKPYNFTYILGKRLVRDGVSLNSTVMGEPYANFGLLGSLLVPAILVAYLKLLCLMCPTGDQGRFFYAACVFGVTSSRNGWMEAAIMVTIGLGVLLAAEARHGETKGRLSNSAERKDCGVLLRRPIKPRNAAA